MVSGQILCTGVVDGRALRLSLAAIKLKFKEICLYL